ncbi:LOW QUALITY PROTEIN: rho GTPase-activating protein 33 [Varanus komodoensis]|uniref:LOW QUALITY PROTEIN: rho GTPase-activating protein 33 n=1 Tax=Varanus komodoensis TaxID=61221 RepID=UPI001CF790E4|nr:LOW QUALITY PROTEIN: rho GTPase-activating protein 33 [Varanus komodoensis]
MVYVLIGDQARSTDSIDTAGEGHVRSLGNANSNIKGKPAKRLSITRGHFPKLTECAHFHYEAVDFGHIQLQLGPEQNENLGNLEEGELLFAVQVTCQGKSWQVHRSYEEFRTLDAHLHCCIFDRRFSQLPELPPFSHMRANPELLVPMLSQYLEKLSAIVDSNINCGPVLTWMEIDNHGNRLLVNEEASINVPAIAAAHVVKRYIAQASDELSFEVGDIISVIDMPPKEDRSWWRGKHGFQVGFFPSECVELFSERPSPGLKTDGEGLSCGIARPHGLLSPTSVSKKHGKLIGFLRTFMKSRPSKQRLKQRGILRERVFGCDLGEHLKNSGSDVPQVLRCCSDFIEKHGIVDGIYRLSGVSSNIQRLRHEFDSERVPELSKDVYLQDIHSVSSLCKLYFRELPNPLLTYQLYNKFAEAVSVPGNEERLVRVHDVIQQLPPPHYRTLEFLLRHLARMAMHSQNTSMHIRNLAIVWAPNLLRSMALESVAQCGADAFREVRVQSLVVEFLLNNVQVLFSDTFTSVGKDSAGRCFLPRPKSQLVSCPSTRLLSLEEAQARTQALCKISKPEAKHGSTDLQGQGKFSAGLGSPDTRQKAENNGRLRKTSGPSWKAFFAIGKAPVTFRKKSHRLGELLRLGEALPGGQAETVTLRSAKSEESLTSQAGMTGLPKLPCLRRPHSSSDAFPTLKPCRSCSSLGSSESGRGEGLAAGTGDAAARRRSSWLEGDSELDSELELSPPGLRGLDFDPLTFQCSPPARQPSLSDSSGSPSPVGALSPCSPPSIGKDTSEPLPVSLPDKVLEMFAGSEARGVNVRASPPHMISMLLCAAGGQLSDSCEREVRCKITQVKGSISAHGAKVEAAPTSPGALSVLRHIPPPPPPKNPARLMALALAESAHQAALQQKQQAGHGRKEPRTHFRRSLSLECKAGELPSGARALYSMVRASPKAPGPFSLQGQARGRSIGGHCRGPQGGTQVPLCQASPLGSSESFSPCRRVLADVPQREPQPHSFSEPYHLSAPSPASPATYGFHHQSPPLSVSYQPSRRPHDPCPLSSQCPAPPKPPPPHFPLVPGHLPRKSRPPASQSYLPDHPLRHHGRFPASSQAGLNGTPPPQLEHENLYYEIVGEPPAYPGLARPWPACPPPEYLATFNAAYGVFERPWRQPALPPGPSALQPILKTPRAHSQPTPPAAPRQEPIYVNVPFPEAPSVSPAPSPPPEAAHPRSHSDPGAAQPVPHHCRPPLPQKQRLGWGCPPAGQYRQLVEALPCSRALLQLYRPPAACWGRPPYGPEPIVTYDGPAARPGSVAAGPASSLRKLDESPPQYGNVERREGSPSGCYLGPSWTVYTEGQTHSYC